MGAAACGGGGGTHDAGPEGGGGQSGSAGGNGGDIGGHGGGGGGSAGGDGGTCVAETGSCASGQTCCGSLTCCSGVPVPAGQEYCAATCPRSDRNIKQDIAPVDRALVLEALDRLPISIWSYKAEQPKARHIGPMAQDFMATFHVGSSDKTILQVDADGVAFAAVQALNARVKQLEQQVDELRAELARQHRRQARR